MSEPAPALLTLEDGTQFHGTAIGARGKTAGAVVFNTAMTGYQEILTDPSYAQQLITLTYPHIGNTGINAEDGESEKMWAKGLIIHQNSPIVSNWRATQSLTEYLQQQGIVAIAHIDTRKLTHHLRDKGTLRGCIMAGDIDAQAAHDTARNAPHLEYTDLVAHVTTQQPYTWNQPSWHAEKQNVQEQAATPYRVTVYDFGVKRNILRLLVDSGCALTVVPAHTPLEEVLADNPDGLVLPNGPGDPAQYTDTIAMIQTLLATKHARKTPVLAICLGYQLLALACGAQTEKMKFGHHGANHPVQNLQTRKVAISSQNHGFMVSESTRPDTLIPTHRSLFDGSLQGMRHAHYPAIGLQGHPEGGPGPHDLHDCFAQFIAMMQ